MNELLKVKLFGRKVPLIIYKNSCNYDEVLINKPDLSKEQIKLIKDNLIFSSIIDEDNDKSEFIKIDTVSKYNNNTVFKNAINTLTKRPLPRTSEEFTDNLVKQRKESGCLENILSNNRIFNAYIKGKEHKFIDIPERWDRIIKLINQEYKLGVLPVKSVVVDDTVLRNDSKRITYTVELKNPTIKLKILEYERLKRTEFIVDFMTNINKVAREEPFLKYGVVIEDKSKIITKYYNFNNYTDKSKHAIANFSISEYKSSDRRGDNEYKYYLSISDNYKAHDVIGNIPETKSITEFRVDDIAKLGRVNDIYESIEKCDEYKFFIKPYSK